MFDLVNEIIMKIKSENPLILNITNDVTVDFVANGLLCLGASPVMSQATKDVEDLIKLAKTVVINIGTLNNNFIELCEYSCQIANALKKPIILDPVGAGASLYRTKTCKQLLNNNRIAIIRANAGEIMALSGLGAKTNGVDSFASSDEGLEFAKSLSSAYDLAICMSGKKDIIIDQHKINYFERGSVFMPMVTGTGCLLSAIVGAFHAVNNDRFEASCAASIFYSICGEIAAEKSIGPGSFKVNFLDMLNAIPSRCHYEKNN